MDNPSISLRHVWHPCTQMKLHDAYPRADCPRRRRVALRLRWPALPGRHQFLVGQLAGGFHGETVNDLATP